MVARAVTTAIVELIASNVLRLRLKERHANVRRLQVQFTKNSGSFDAITNDVDNRSSRCLLVWN